MGEQRRRCVVKKPASSDAQDGAVQPILRQQIWRESGFVFGSVFMHGQVIDKSLDRGGDPNPASFVERTAINVQLRQSERLDRNLIEIGRQRMILQKRFG